MVYGFGLMVGSATEADATRGVSRDSVRMAVKSEP